MRKLTIAILLFTACVLGAGERAKVDNGTVYDMATLDVSAFKKLNLPDTAEIRQIQKVLKVFNSL